MSWPGAHLILNYLFPFKPLLCFAIGFMETVSLSNQVERKQIIQLLLLLNNDCSYKFAGSIATEESLRQLAPSEEGQNIINEPLPHETSTFKGAFLFSQVLFFICYHIQNLIAALKAKFDSSVGTP
jgi:hypothetical protein